MNSCFRPFLSDMMTLSFVGSSGNSVLDSTSPAIQTMFSNSESLGSLIACGEVT